MNRAAAPAPLPFLPDAVMFDMDGLMLDSERAINACMASAARELGHALPESLWLQMTGGGDGHHLMYRNVNVGNHDNAVLYLWIAFRR